MGNRKKSELTTFLEATLAGMAAEETDWIPILSLGAALPISSVGKSQTRGPSYHHSLKTDPFKSPIL